jgi:imidazolonepropionase-like amidohydrolase
MLGWQDRIGSVEPGKFANPIADITEFERVRFVMKDGQVVRKMTLRRIEAHALFGERTYHSI